MIVLAHVMMLPVEEVLLPLAGGAGAGTALFAMGALQWLRYKTKRH